jgi:uncharacterized protein YbjT (DUF2867 family)
MSRVIILGATGSLGRHVLRQSVAAGHEVTVFVTIARPLTPRARCSIPHAEPSGAYAQALSGYAGPHDGALA